MRRMPRRKKRIDTKTAFIHNADLSMMQLRPLRSFPQRSLFFVDNFLFLHKIVLQLDIQHTVFVIFLKHYILWNNDLQRLKISYEKIFYKVLILVSIY